MTYTVYNSTSQEVIASGRPWPTNDPEVPPPGLPADVYLLLEQNGAPPVYDPAIEKLGGYGARVMDIVAGTATQTREVLQLTPEELAANAREEKRDAMASAWLETPGYIQANYTYLYLTAVDWLDQDRDDLALTIVEDADPLLSISSDPQKLAVFEAVKAQMIADIEAL
tara:strand:- start:424 stop:930 length:507 start_codon:yes stop_codon:yes gene_type:complete